MMNDIDGPRPNSFRLKFGLDLESITPAARRHEARPAFKSHVTHEIRAVFSGKWVLAVAARLERELHFDPETAYIDDGDLQNQLNTDMQALGVQTTEMASRSCYFDEEGCWWKVRTFRLSSETSSSEAESDGRPWRSEVAAARYGEALPKGTRRELGRLPYTVTVEWRVCPPDDGGSDTPEQAV